MEKGAKISYILLAIYILLGIIDNFVGIRMGVEAWLAILTLISFAVFLISLFLNILTYLWRRQPTDIWKLGWIGLLGLLGFIPGFGSSFFGLYGFFGFFGFKNPAARSSKK